MFLSLYSYSLTVQKSDGCGGSWSLFLAYSPRGRSFLNTSLGIRAETYLLLVLVEAREAERRPVTTLFHPPGAWVIPLLDSRRFEANALATGGSAFPLVVQSTSA
jgi:hypothetical protein